MNKTITIGLAGFSIIIDENAYQKLHHYLQALRQTLDQEEANEVMHDIELRIVELLKSFLENDKREVVNEQDIAQIITQMGTPEQINNEADEAPKAKTTQSAPKQLFRNPDDKIFSGTASGIAEYLGVKTLWVRILFVLLSFTLTTIIVYLVLWAIVPLAQTASEKLKMKGQPINFENLKEQSTEFARKTNQELGELVEGLKPTVRNLGDLILKIATILLKVIGVIFILVALSMIAGLIMGALALSSSLDTSLMENINFFIENEWIRNCMFLAAILTFILFTSIFIYLGIKCISPQTKIKFAGWFIGLVAVFWFISCIVCASFPISINAKQNNWKEKIEKITVNTTNDTLYFSQTPTALPQNVKNYIGNIKAAEGKIYEEAENHIEIVSEDIPDAKVEIIKSGYANDNELSINYPIVIEGNRIKLPNLFTTSVAYKFLHNQVRIKVSLPKNKFVIAEKPLFVWDDEKHIIDSVYQQERKIKIK